MRCFVAVDIPREEVVKIAKIQMRLAQFTAVRLVPAESIHITLEFLGELKDSQVEKVKNALAKAAERNKAFHCTGGRLNVLPSPSFFRVICVDLDCKELFSLLQKNVSREIEAALGRKNRHNREEFTPHITFARVKGAGEKNSILDKLRALNEKLPEISFDVAEIKLKQSILEPGGAKYADIGRFPLSA